MLLWVFRGLEWKQKFLIEHWVLTPMLSWKLDLIGCCPNLFYHRERTCPVMRSTGVNRRENQPKTNTNQLSG